MANSIKVVSLIHQTNKMKTDIKNIFGIEVGDIITFTNSVNHKVELRVDRVEAKSWYSNGRNSYGTLKNYSKYPDFKIIKQKTKNKLYESN